MKRVVNKEAAAGICLALGEVVQEAANQKHEAMTLIMAICGLTCEVLDAGDTGKVWPDKLVALKAAAEAAFEELLLIAEWEEKREQQPHLRVVQ